MLKDIKLYKGTDNKYYTRNSIIELICDKLFDLNIELYYGFGDDDDIIVDKLYHKFIEYNDLIQIDENDSIYNFLIAYGESKEVDRYFSDDENEEWLLETYEMMIHKDYFNILFDEDDIRCYPEVVKQFLDIVTTVKVTIE